VLSLQEAIMTRRHTTTPITKFYATSNRIEDYSIPGSLARMATIRPKTALGGKLLRLQNIVVERVAEQTVDEHRETQQRLADRVARIANDKAAQGRASANRAAMARVMAAAARAATTTT
jgi:hypothetical protein